MQSTNKKISHSETVHNTAAGGIIGGLSHIVGLTQGSLLGNVLFGAGVGFFLPVITRAIQKIL